MLSNLFSYTYNYIFNYKTVKCCGCNKEMLIKNPIENMSYSCSNGCTFTAFYESEKIRNAQKTIT